MLSPTSAPRVLVERTERIMATPCEVHVAVPAAREAEARAAVAACLAWLREVDTTLTRFAPNSELSRLNAAAGRWRAVSAMLFDVVEQAVEAARETRGLFDPALLPLLERLGYDRDFAAIAYHEVEVADEHDQAPASDGERTGRWRDIELDRGGRRIRLPPGVRLDLGGIAKGWAADRALDQFFAPFAHVIVSVGGDMRVRGGAQTGECWAIGIGGAQGPAGARSQEHAAVVTLGRGGLATSGAIDRWWYRDGQRQHHLIDPRTGQPARVWVAEGDSAIDGRPLIVTATALAPTAARAEVAAKVALLRGYPEALSRVEAARRPARSQRTGTYADTQVALLLVLGTGEVVCSAHLHDYLEIFGGGGNVWLS